MAKTMNDKSDPDAKSAADIALEERVSFGNAMHLDFEQQIQNILATWDLSDEDRQSILAGMSCPCCGGNGASFTIPLGETR